MDVKLYKFPTEKDDLSKIEKKFCELNSKYRNGESLDEVEITWMDTANNWLLAQ